ncbi:MAG: hypothetical protein II773_13240 [Oscillospiraceae bacterium]|nr:hypothetical protein [Oscillospiraceae bacterium]
MKINKLIAAAAACAIASGIAAFGASAEETTAPETEKDSTSAETTVAETTAAETTTVEETTADTETEPPAVSDAVLAFESLCASNGVLLGENCGSQDWGQAIVKYTYNNIAEGDEPGDDGIASSALTTAAAVIVFYQSESAPEFIMQSWSGGASWAKIAPNALISQPGIAVFTYDDMLAGYGSDDFSTLDAVYVGDTGSPLAVRSAYLVDITALGAFMDSDAADEDAEIDAEAETEETVEEAVEEEAPEEDEAPEEAEEEEEEAVEEEAPAEDEAPEEDAAEEEAPAEEAPAETTVESDSVTEAAPTGNIPAQAFAGIMAAASAAAIAFRKRK